MAKRKSTFMCPVCGHDKSKEVCKPEGQFRTSLMSMRHDHYECDGDTGVCTTHFSDPEKFSKKKTAS